MRPYETRVNIDSMFYARSKYHTQQAKRNFDQILDLIEPLFSGIVRDAIIITAVHVVLAACTQTQALLNWTGSLDGDCC